MRSKLFSLLGERSCPGVLEGTIISTEQIDNFRLERYMLTINGIETVPAICCLPLQKSKKPYPVVLYQHSHGGDFEVGKSELVDGAAYLFNKSFAKELTERGFAVWAIDAWGFEERAGVQESELFKEFLLTGRTLWGMRLYDCIGLIDYLESRNDMDLSSLVTIGMSMGGLISWWLAALDERIKVCVDLCAQVNLETLMEARRLDHHGYYYYVPSLLKHFSTKEIQELIIPRARMSLSGRRDTMSLNSGVLMLNGFLREQYKLAGAATSFSGLSLTGGHFETAEMRYHWLNFLEEHSRCEEK